MLRTSLLIMAVFALSGCFHSAIGMTPSTKPLEQGGYEELGPAKGTDCLWLFLGAIPISTGNTLQGATKEAIRDRKGADALIQVTADSFFQHYIIVARSCTQVEGIAVRSK